MSLKIATVFSGIGAFEHTLEQMSIDYDIIFACDNDKFVKKTYTANFKHKPHVWYDNIVTLNGGMYNGSVDILVGGSPCQAFSIAGNKAGFNDYRGGLFYEFIRLINEIQPMVFIFENVAGVLSHNKGKTWATMVASFKTLGYYFTPMVLNAKHYGIPQNRNRLFVIGSKNNIQLHVPPVQELTTKISDYLEPTVDEKYFLSQQAIAYVTRLSKLKKCYTQINGDVALCQRSNQQINNSGDFYFSPNANGYNLSDETLKFIENKNPLQRGIINKLGKLRRLTPRECLRLMGFVDTYKQVVSDTQMYKQCGNSIVTTVLKAIVTEILNLNLFNINKNGVMYEKHQFKN